MMDKPPVCSCGRTLPRCLMSGVVRCVCGATYGNKAPNLPQDESDTPSRPPTRGKGKTANLDEAGAIGTAHGDAAKGGRD